MTREKYIEMCKQMGDEIDWNKCPRMLEDFPAYVHFGIEIFNCLPDTYIPTMDQPIYGGKNLSSFDILMNVLDAPREEVQDIFSIVQLLDSRAREEAIRKAKKKK